MNNLIKAFTVILFFPVALQAQTGAPPLQLSLQAAKDLALKNNPRTRAGSLNTEIARETVAQTKFKRLPQVYGDFNLQRNLIIPVTPVPANAFNPNAPEGELLPRRFSTKWTANTGLNADIDLFNPQQKQELREVRLQVEISKTQEAMDQRDLAYDVSAAYAAALIAAEQLRLAAADTLTQAKIAKMSQEQFEEGRLLATAFNQVKAERNHALDTYHEAQNIARNAQAELRYYLGYDPADTTRIDFIDTIEGLYSGYKSNGMGDSTESLSLRKLKQDEELISTQIAAAKSGFLPVLSLKGYYGANYFDNNFELFKSGNWNGNSFINVGLRIPITEGFERQKKLSQLKLQNQVNSLNYQDQLHKNNLDLLSAARDVVFYQDKYKRAVENYRMAEENFGRAAQQYTEGRLLISEYYQQHYAFQQEKNSYLNVIYNYIVSRLKQDRLRAH